MRLSARQIELFQAAFRLKSTRRAADLMHVSQPAISRAVTEIEAEIGVVLFDRSGRKFEPTAAARSLNDAVQRHYHGLNRVIDAAQMIARGTSGHLKVVALPAIAAALVSRAAGRLMAKHPGVRIDVEVRGEGECLTAVRSGNADCAVISSDPGALALACHQVATITPVVAVSRTDVLAGLAQVTPEQLVEKDLVMLPPDSPFRQALEKTLSDAALAFTIRAEARTQAALLEYVNQGIGRAVVAAGAADARARPDIVLLPFAASLVWPVRAVGAASEMATPLLQQFLAEMTSLASPSGD
jgi:LysR family transcriptional regulator, low CO2-responsive transcriptional regulator